MMDENAERRDHNYGSSVYSNRGRGRERDIRERKRKRERERERDTYTSKQICRDRIKKKKKPYGAPYRVQTVPLALRDQAIVNVEAEVGAHRRPGLVQQPLIGNWTRVPPARVHVPGMEWQGGGGGEIFKKNK